MLKVPIIYATTLGYILYHAIFWLYSVVFGFEDPLFTSDQKAVSWRDIQPLALSLNNIAIIGVLLFGQ